MQFEDRFSVGKVGPPAEFKELNLKNHPHLVGKDEDDKQEPTVKTKPILPRSKLRAIVLSTLDEIGVGTVRGITSALLKKYDFANRDPQKQVRNVLTNAKRDGKADVIDNVWHVIHNTQEIPQESEKSMSANAVVTEDPKVDDSGIAKYTLNEKTDNQLIVMGFTTDLKTESGEIVRISSAMSDKEHKDIKICFAGNEPVSITDLKAIIDYVGSR